MVTKKKAIFFDRDGTLIETFVTKDLIPKAIQSIDQFKLCSYAKFVVNRLSKHFLIIIITNQPDVDRGLNKKINVERINKKLKKILNINKIYTCYSSNNKDIMRKPNPGMILTAQKKFNIDIKNSFVIGDRDKDIKCGKKVGCKTILLKKKYNNVEKIKPDFAIKNLKEVLKIIKF